MPFLIKDLYATYAGQRISNGNLALKNANIISDADTTLVGRFRGAGLVIAGRTNSPELGSVPPDVFIPVAEAIGLIPELGRRMLWDGAQDISFSES